MAASETEIANLALQMLGVGDNGRIGSMADDSPNARSCRNCYHMLRKAELRKRTWGFAFKLVQIAAHADAPAFDYARAFIQPGDCLRIIKPRRNDCDWRTANHAGLRAILTNDAAPLSLPYVIDVTDTTLFDASFDVALAAKMAMHMCEEITQSNQKKADAAVMYRDAINQAKQDNAFEQVPAETDEDTWLTAMQS